MIHRLTVRHHLHNTSPVQIGRQPWANALRMRFSCWRFGRQTKRRAWIHFRYKRELRPSRVATHKVAILARKERNAHPHTPQSKERCNARALAMTLVSPLTGSYRSTRPRAEPCVHVSCDDVSSTKSAAQQTAQWVLPSTESAAESHGVNSD